MEKYTYDFNYMLNKYSVEKVTLDDIKDIVKKVSIDMVSGNNQISEFASDSVTYLYSGYTTDTVHSGSVITELDNARIIDRTEAAYLLNSDKFEDLLKHAFQNDIQGGRFTSESINEIAKGLYIEDLNELADYLGKSNLTEFDLQRAAEIATNGYLFEPTTGAWATISERFVMATPEGSVINCYTSRADLGRTWAQVEVVTMLDKLPDTQVVGTTTVGELRALRNQSCMDAVYSKMMSVSADLVNGTRLHIDSDGKIIGISNAEGMYSGSSKFKTSTKNYMNYSTEIDMKSKYPDYDNYNSVEKLQARQYDYEKRFVSDMYDRGVTNSFSMPSIFAKVSMIAEIVFDNFCLIIYHYCGVINNRY